MKFDNVPADDAKTEFPVFPAGEYDAVVMSALEGFTKSGPNAGNPNIKLKLNVFPNDGSERTQHVYCYMTNGGFITRDVLKLLGKTPADEVSEHDLQDLACRVKLKIAPASNGYPEKNEIDRFVMPKGGQTPRAASNPADDLSDSIPF